MSRRLLLLAVGVAVGVETLEDVLAEVRREGGLRVGTLAMQGARPAALLAAAAQLVEQSQVSQHLFQTDLPT